MKTSWNVIHKDVLVCKDVNIVVDPLTPTVAMWVQLSIKHPVPDRVKPLFVIFDIRAL